MTNLKTARKDTFISTYRAYFNVYNK